jgi:hypothetical protein
MVSLIVAPVVAASVAYTASINIANTTATNYGVIGCNVTMPISNMITTGMIAANGFDTAVSFGSNVPTMVTTTAVYFATNVPNNATQLGTFTTNNAPLLASYYIIPGYGGFISPSTQAVPITDNATPHDWSIVIRGYLKRAAATPYLIQPIAIGGVSLVTSAADNMTAKIGGGLDIYSAFVEGLQTITLTDNITHFKLSTTSAAATAANERAVGTHVGAGWYNMLQAMVYTEYVKIYHSGVLTEWYEPNAILAGAVLPDREGAAVNALIIAGTNPVGVTIGSMYPASVAAPVSNAVSGSAVPGINQPSNMTTTNEKENAPGTVFDPLFTSISQMSGSPAFLIWMLAYSLLGLVAFVGTFMFTQHLWISGMALLAVTAGFTAMGVIPGLFIILVILLTIGLGIMERTQTI